MPREKQDLHRISLNLPSKMFDGISAASADQEITMTDYVDRAIKLTFVLDALAGETGYVMGIDREGNEKTIILDPLKFATHIEQQQIDK